MANTPEGRVKDAIKILLKQYGVWYFMPVSTGRGRIGIPDFICCLDGNFIAIEAKSKHGKPTPAQVGEMADIQNAGGEVLVINDPVTLKEYLDAYQARKSQLQSGSFPRVPPKATGPA